MQALTAPFIDSCSQHFTLRLAVHRWAVAVAYNGFDIILTHLSWWLWVVLGGWVVGGRWWVVGVVHWLRHHFDPPVFALRGVKWN